MKSKKLLKLLSSDQSLEVVHREEKVKNISDYIKELQLTNSATIITNLLKATEVEKILIIGVIDYFKQYAKDHSEKETELKHLIAEFLKGGQIIFPDDNGELYNDWKNLQNKNKGEVISRKGASSHQSADEQFAIRGRFVKEALFGTRIINGKKHTWLQLESHSTDFRYLLGHLISYVIYKVTGMNVGPYGRSKYVEKTPLNLSEEHEARPVSHASTPSR